MTAETQAVVSYDVDSMSPLLHLAIEKNVSVETLTKLVDLHERVEARAAAKEYADAMARFQAGCPPIAKTSTASIATKGGSRYEYRYAELDEIARTAGPHLHKNGLSYSWDSTISEDGKRIRVVCTVAHVNGHKATASFEAPTASLSGSMSPQQEVAAALTFGRRQSLVQALGLTTSDPDNDGSTGSGPCCTPEQVDTLTALLDQCPPGTSDKMLRYVGVKTLDDVPARRFEALKKDLETKIKAQK